MQNNSTNKKSIKDKNKSSNNKTIIEENTNNMNNNVCQCGQVLQPGWKFCPNCRKKITSEIKTNNNVGNNQNQTDGNVKTYLIVFAICAASGFLFPPLFLAAIITIITAKIKFPNNSLVETIFWVTISVFVAFIVFVLWFMITCYNAIQSCPG